uniref:Non-structural maintenance of chromosomes element 1 homolog n=2 Tax=Culex pipiens TaxID=7175 RepID=A0A8D8ALZ2_CULPI
MAYSDVHRAFLQSISHHGFISSKQALTILLSIYTKYHPDDTIPNEHHLLHVITSINAKIARYSQKIKLVRFEPNRTDYYVFCNLSDRTPADRLHTCYTDSEVAYFWLVLKEMACCDGQAASPFLCLYLSELITDKPRLSKVRAEELLDEWTRAGYFYPESNGTWILGVRTVAEFGQFLREKFEDKIHVCLLCKEATFYGVNCRHCPGTFHTRCIKTYLQRLTVCPGCKEMWIVTVDGFKSEEKVNTDHPISF